MAKLFTFNRSVLLPQNCQQIYDLIDDVASYKDFLPNCSSSGVFSRTLMENKAEHVHGWLGLGIAGISQKFTTQNTHTPHSGIIMRLEDGPFETLEGQWTLKPLHAEDFSGCKATLDMQWAFNSTLLTMTIGAAFGKVAGQLMDAFVAEAERRYG